MRILNTPLILLLTALPASSVLRANERAALKLGEESIPASEAKDIETIAATIEAQLAKRYATERPARRDAHAKAHGCVRALTTIDTHLPEDLRVGIFQPGFAYKSWIRLSNGSGESERDSKGDGRGMAIKLIDVPGDPLLDGEVNANGDTTMDILLINHPRFFVHDAHDYVGLSKAAAKGGAAVLWWFLNPLKSHYTEFGIVNDIRGNAPSSPLGMRYWSMVPSRLGAGTAVKYSARPCGGEKPPLDKKKLASENALLEALKGDLAEGPACYELLVQKQTDPARMPIEDAMAVWPDQGDSAFRKVATIEIEARQPFDTPARQEFCENLSMTPWHATAEHQPLGGIQRVRKVVYQTISKLRHSLNQAPRREPTGDEFSAE